MYFRKFNAIQQDFRQLLGEYFIPVMQIVLRNLKFLHQGKFRRLFHCFEKELDFIVNFGKFAPNS